MVWEWAHMLQGQSFWPVCQVFPLLLRAKHISVMWLLCQNILSLFSMCWRSEVWESILMPRLPFEAQLLAELHRSLLIGAVLHALIDFQEIELCGAYFQQQILSSFIYHRIFPRLDKEDLPDILPWKRPSHKLKALCWCCLVQGS